MIFHFYSPRALEPWDWRNPDEKGIGNSETSHIEMALRLAKRGHEVYSYTNRPEPQDVYGGVRWYDLKEAEFSEQGVWVLYRCPEVLEQFTHRSRAEQQVWVVVQDTYFAFTDCQAAMVDQVLVLCEAQKKEQAKQSANVADKLVVTSNGIRTDMIEDVESSWEPCPNCATATEEYCDNCGGTGELPRENRNPHRIHFSSSPDRGLMTILRHIFPRVREYIPDAELHVYYGLDNIEKLMSQGTAEEQERAKKFFKPALDAVELAKQTPGVTWHGRIGQRDLTREWLKAGVWVFPSTYPESSCATCMEAQALGAIPVAHPLWGVGENVKWGTLIAGANPESDPLTQVRYAAEVVRLMLEPNLEPYRRAMMADARQRFNWDNFVTQWEVLAQAEAPVVA